MSGLHGRTIQCVLGVSQGPSFFRLGMAWGHLVSEGTRSDEVPLDLGKRIGGHLSQRKVGRVDLRANVLLS